MTDHEQNRRKRKLGRRAALLYSILAVCLLGVGAVAYATVNMRLNPEPAADSASKTAPAAENETVRFDVSDWTQPVNDIVTGVPDDRATESPSQETQTAVQAAATEITRAPGFSLPLAGTVDKAFSGGDMVQSKTMGDWRVHNGADIRGTVGDPVIAINNGVVKAVYDDVLWGTVVEIDHGQGMLARYCGLGKGSTVEVGDAVKINDKVGNLGTIPIEAAEEPHLHLEILQDGASVDPLAAMGKNAKGETVS